MPESEVFVWNAKMVTVFVWNAKVVTVFDLELN